MASIAAPKRHPLRLAGLVAGCLVLVAALATLVLFLWLRTYSPLDAAGSGGFAPGPGLGADVEPVTGSGGKTVFIPAYRKNRPFDTAFTLHNSGRFAVTVTGLAKDRSLPQLEPAVSEEEPVYLGGPVQPGSVVLLAEFLDPAQAGLFVLGRIGFPAADADIERLGEATARRRVFAGFAGWGEGQLDAEVEHGDWIAHSALAEDVFTDVPEELWSRVLTRKGGHYALIARMPLDPSEN